MHKTINGKKEKGFTIVELLIVAAMIGVLLALSIPIVIRARISANEANARKAMQVLRDSEVLYFEQDLDLNGTRDYTAQIGDLSTPGTLRCPSDFKGACVEADSLIDDSFEHAVASDTIADCIDPKSGYCIQFAGDIDDEDPSALQVDFGWETSMTSAHKNGRRDFAIYADGVIRCTASLEATANPGKFEASHTSGACDN